MGAQNMNSRTLIHNSRECTSGKRHWEISDGIHRPPPAASWDSGFEAIPLRTLQVLRPGRCRNRKFPFLPCLVSYLVVTTYVGGPGLFMGQECPARPRIRSGSSRPRWRVWAQGTAFLVPALLAPGSHASVAGSPPTRALTFADSRTASGLNHGCERHGRPGARELAAELR